MITYNKKAVVTTHATIFAQGDAFGRTPTMGIPPLYDAPICTLPFRIEDAS